MSARSDLAIQVQRPDGSVDVDELARILCVGKAEIKVSVGQ